MNINEAKQILTKAGFLVENTFDYIKDDSPILRKEINKWNDLLNKLDKVKTHHYKIVNNKIVEKYQKIDGSVGVDAVWSFVIEDDEDIYVVVRWPNRPEWQEKKPVRFEYTLDKYEDYEKDVKEFLTYTGIFH